nr:MAG TPA: hypothetical protein [Caudoviricetes sp.]
MRLSFCCACVESGPFTLPSGRDFFCLYSAECNPDRAWRLSEKV